MKYFDRDGKHNFVDLNNVFVGFDSGQSCCEHADWYIEDRVSIGEDFDGELNQPEELPDFLFDPTFFREYHYHYHRDLDEGGVAVFRLLDGKGGEKFLHLFNCHNGYYGHGFEMGICGDSFLDEQQVAKQGSI